MLLAIDVGNTNIQFALYEGAALTMSFRLSTRREATSDEIGLAARNFFQMKGIDPAGLEEILVVSVVPPIMHALTRALQGYFGKTPKIVGEDLAVPIENGYAHPKEVGADRLVGAYAGKCLFGYPLIVVDMGTATTFDTVGRSGEYLGGAIFPGVKLSLEALVAHASKLPRVEIADPGVAIGRTTIESIQSGVLHGYQGAILHLIDRIEQELGAKAHVIGTGGLAKTIAGDLGIFENIQPALILDGLRMIYENAQKHGEH